MWRQSGDLGAMTRVMKQLRRLRNRVARVNSNMAAQWTRMPLCKLRTSCRLFSSLNRVSTLSVTPLEFPHHYANYISRDTLVIFSRSLTNCSQLRSHDKR